MYLQFQTKSQDCFLPLTFLSCLLFPFLSSLHQSDEDPSDPSSSPPLSPSVSPPPHSEDNDSEEEDEDMDERENPRFAKPKNVPLPPPLPPPRPKWQVRLPLRPLSSLCECDLMGYATNS